jgi:hypothetical protein
MITGVLYRNRCGKLLSVVGWGMVSTILRRWLKGSHIWPSPACDLLRIASDFSKMFVRFLPPIAGRHTIYRIRHAVGTPGDPGTGRGWWQVMLGATSDWLEIVVDIGKLGCKPRPQIMPDIEQGQP